MPPPRPLDPYKTLGVSPGASDAEIRTAYRRLVQQHHPDHNHGSEESERRFEEVQEAYARIRELRAGGRAGPAAGRARAGSATGRRTTTGSAPPRYTSSPADDARLADLERQVREAAAARERAAKAAREAAAAAEAQAGLGSERRRPTDEELGYITTDDSFSRILADARDELAQRLSGAREHPVTQRVSDLIEELEDILGRPRKPGR